MFRVTDTSADVNSGGRWWATTADHAKPKNHGDETFYSSPALLGPKVLHV